MFAELIRARLQALIEAEATEATGARRYQGNGECPVHLSVVVLSEAGAGV